MLTISLSSPNALKAAVKALANGGLVVFPSETCYGIAADATNPAAVTKLLTYKNRPVGKAISIAVSNQQMAAEYVEINAEAKQIYSKFLPGPVTVISTSKCKVDTRLESEAGTIGVRISSYNFVQELVTAFGKPITATSANPSGGSSPYSLPNLLTQLSVSKQKLLDLIVDAGVLPTNPPSTVIDTTLETAVVYRQGEIELGILKEKYISVAETETLDFASSLTTKLNWTLNKLSPELLIFFLNGDMGAGKTYFVKGIAQALNLDPLEVTSPTYNYVQEYNFAAGRKLVHCDAWRIKSAEEFAALEFADYLKPGNIVAIEWSDKISGYLSTFLRQVTYKALRVSIKPISETEREISIYE